MKINTKSLGKIGMCFMSGFASQIGTLFARKLFNKFDKKDSKKSERES